MAAFLNPAADAERERFLADALAGLRQRPKTLPCKYFYDAEGSKLFDQICALPEYYPTRTELGILRAHAADMARALGPETLLVEYGSGSSVKTRRLLDPLGRPAAYVPAAAATFAAQQSATRGTTETSPRRARKAPRATAVSAGTGGNTFSSAESTISTR